MDIRQGFLIHSPAIRVPWGISETEITYLFKGHSLRAITKGYYTLPCEPLSDLYCSLGFHFRPTNQLNELEFFRTDYPDQKKCFDDFQSSFEETFGSPTKTEESPAGFPQYTWTLTGIEIVHFIVYRFCLEEHMRIRKI